MRILHIADLHLGVSFKNVRGRDIARTVNKHILSNVEKAFKYALDNNIDIVLIAGDIFNNLHSSLNYSYALASKLSLLYKHGIYTVIIAGNHDVPRVRGLHSPLLILPELKVDKVYYQESLPEKALKIDFDEGCLGIIPLPFIQPSEKKSFQNKLSVLIRSLYSGIKNCDFKILIGHYDVKGARYSEEDPYTNTFYDITRISPKTLEPELFNYVALGHIHLHQSIKGFDNMFYSGSVDRISFGEVSEKKGFLNVELYGNSLHVKFVETNPLKMHVTPFLEVDRTNPVSTIIQYLDTVELKNKLIRVKVKADYVTWSIVKDSMGKLDKYILDERKALGYRVDPYLENIYAQLKLEKISLDEDWLRESLDKYIDSLTEFPRKYKIKLKKLLSILLSERVRRT